VTCALATNNVLNPFTPFGDCSLIRMANLYANIAQAGAPHQLAACFDLVTTQPARLMNLEDYGLALGNPADLVLLDCGDAAMAIAEISCPLLGLKSGRRSFTRSAPLLYPPMS
jgi:cytosine deaminase